MKFSAFLHSLDPFYAPHQIDFSCGVYATPIETKPADTGTVTYAHPKNGSPLGRRTRRTSPRLSRRLTPIRGQSAVYPCIPRTRMTVRASQRLRLSRHIRRWQLLPSSTLSEISSLLSWADENGKIYSNLRAMILKGSTAAGTMWLTLKRSATSLLTASLWRS